MSKRAFEKIRVGLEEAIDYSRSALQTIYRCETCDKERGAIRRLPGRTRAISIVEHAA